MRRVLILDGYNLLHRARYSGIRGGNYTTVYHFFRSLRPLIEKFDPDIAYFTLEGSPRHRLELDENYKGNRRLDIDDPDYEKKMAEEIDFRKQKNAIVSLLRHRFPIKIAFHDNYEADDVIYSLVNSAKDDDQVTVVSSDSDFIQLLSMDKDIQLWNPIKKEFVQSVNYDYVMWKAMVGDASDNIIGVKGIGPKTAEKLLDDPKLMKERLKRPDFKEKVEKNVKLIEFHMVDDMQLIFDMKIDWEDVHQRFTEMRFFSMTGSSWGKFVETFSRLISNI